MKLPRRAPREVYRVYAEEDFLAGLDQGASAGVEEQLLDGAEEGDHVDLREPPVRPAGAGMLSPTAAESGRAARGLRRAAGAAMLTGAVGALVVLLAINGLLPASDPSRRLAQEERPVVGTAAGSLGTPSASHRPGPPAAASGERWGRSLQGVSRTLTGLRRGVKASHGGSASARDLAVGMSSAEPTTVASMTASAGAGSHRTDDPEFGFER